MAKPCTVGPHMHKSRKRLAYLHLWAPGEQRDLRLRLCSEHLALVEEDLSKYEVITLDDASGIGARFSECLACGQPATKSDWYFSLTCYVADDESKDYSARLHVDHSLPAWAEGGERSW